jgi:predicted nucleotidyltransferase
MPDDLIREAAVQVPEEDLREIVRRIVAAVDPEKIILFGSAARGTMGPDSDLDLLVIKSGEYDHRREVSAAYEALREIDYSKDILLVSAEILERYKDSSCLIYYPAVREGRVIYDKTTIPAR